MVQCIDSKGQINHLEKNQKVAHTIILFEDYMSYELAWSTFNIEQMSDRRPSMATNYAVKLYESDHRHQFFTHTNMRNNASWDQ